MRAFLFIVIMLAAITSHAQVARTFESPVNTEGRTVTRFMIIGDTLQDFVSITIIKNSQEVKYDVARIEGGQRYFRLYFDSGDIEYMDYQLGRSLKPRGGTLKSIQVRHTDGTTITYRSIIEKSM